MYDNLMHISVSVIDKFFGMVAKLVYFFSGVYSWGSYDMRTVGVILLLVLGGRRFWTSS